MATVPARRAAAAPARRAGPPARRPAAPAGSSGYRGAAGLAKMQEEEEKQQQAKEASAQMAGMPFRFYCPSGDSRELIVVDEAPDFFRHEHNLQNPRTGKYDIFTACINDHANCPVCKSTNRQPYFGMYLTVIDLTGYEASTGEWVEWSKKLLVVKPAQQKKIMRKFDEYGTLRGLLLRMTRDGDKDASIGNDIEVVDQLTEEQLEAYVTTYVDKKDVEHEVIGFEVFDYDELFPEATEEQLIAISGGRAEIGSRSNDRSTLRGGSRSGGSGDGWDRPSTARGGARPAMRRRGDDEVEDVEPREPAPRTRTAPPARTTAPARAPLRRAAVAEPEYEEPGADEAPPPRSRAPVRAPARTPLRRAAAPVDDEPQRPAARAPLRRAPVTVEEDDAPAQPATSLADRRRQLRRP